MTTKSKRLILILSVLLLVFWVAAVWSYSGRRPTFETRRTVYVVPWPQNYTEDNEGPEV